MNEKTPPRRKNFRALLLAEIASLRKFAIFLSGSVQLADDLVQETLLKALSNSEKFDTSTTIQPWLFTIMRNTYYSQYRKRWREVADTDGVFSSKVAVNGAQDGVLDLADMTRALAKLPMEQRESVVMVCAIGLSYEEAAQVTGVAIGTVKSRVSRARVRLAELLGLTNGSGGGGGGPPPQQPSSGSVTLVV